MARTLKSDKTLFWVTLLLAGASIVMIYSASAGTVLAKQILWVALGLGVLLAGMRIDYHEFRRPVVIWSILGATTLALVAVYFFPFRNGTQRWIEVGSVTFQPSEVAKLAALFFTAALLDRRMHRVNDGQYALLPIGIVTAVLAALIVKEPDFGTAAVVVMVVLAVVFSAGLSFRYLVGAALVMLPAAMILILTSGYRSRRLTAFIDPWSDRFGYGYQAVQASIAVGSGGLLGSGLMANLEKNGFLPELHNDFIFAAIGEGLGLVGTTLTLVCFAVVAWRGLRIALVAPDRFGSLLAIGLTVMVAAQALVNMSMVIGLLPTKGIPLPFLSNGGSSLLVNMAAIAILLNISQQASSVAAGSLEARG